jgi:hypothetical protein
VFPCILHICILYALNTDMFVFMSLCCFLCLPTLQATAATTTTAASAAPVNAKRSRDDSNNDDAPSTKQQRFSDN